MKYDTDYYEGNFVEVSIDIPDALHAAKVLALLLDGDNISIHDTALLCGIARQLKRDATEAAEKQDQEEETSREISLEAGENEAEERAIGTPRPGVVEQIPLASMEYNPDSFIGISPVRYPDSAEERRRAAMSTTDNIVDDLKEAGWIDPNAEILDQPLMKGKSITCDIGDGRVLTVTVTR